MASRTRVLITGGSGRLGQALRFAYRKRWPQIDVFAPPRTRMDVCDFHQCYSVEREFHPDVVIHAAAYANTSGCEQDKKRAWRENVFGTATMLQAFHGRLVFISTDYVFAGDGGAPYREHDVPAPVNYYGLTKLVAEERVLSRANTLVLRAPFRRDPPWHFRRAFSDQYTSCIWASDRAPQIALVAGMPLVGILHLGGPRRSILSMAREASPNVGEMLRAEADVPLPADVSLDDALWHESQRTLSDDTPHKSPQ